MSSEYSAVLIPNLLKKAAISFHGVSVFPFNLMQGFWRAGFSSGWGVAVLFQPGPQAHVKWEMWLGVIVTGHCQLLLCQWSCGNFCWATVEAELCSFSPCCFSLEHWALAIPKLFGSFVFFRMCICKVRILSVEWHFILGTAELIAKIPGSRTRAWFLLCTISLQFLSEMWSSLWLL